MKKILPLILGLGLACPGSAMADHPQVPVWKAQFEADREAWFKKREQELGEHKRKLEAWREERRKQRELQRKDQQQYADLRRQQRKQYEAWSKEQRKQYLELKRSTAAQ